MSDVMAHRHRRTDVQDVLYDGSEESRHHIARWAVGTGNEAKVHGEHLLVKTEVKWAQVPRGFWVGLGYVGQLWVISNDVHVGCYDPIGPDFNAVVTRDQAAAMAVAADELVDEATHTDGISGRAFGMVEQLRLYVHQLATSLEAKR